MVSRIITPPDQIKSKQNFLVINAAQEELTTLVLWLKTIPDQFDIHLYHSQMSDTDWVLDVAQTVETILVSENYKLDLEPSVQKMLLSLDDRVIYFGNTTEYPDLIHFFLTKKEIS
jgi:MarR-like DNA-binding transcriptional regulator SgrR of sgrS sRNA